VVLHLDHSDWIRQQVVEVACRDEFRIKRLRRHRINRSFVLREKDSWPMGKTWAAIYSLDATDSAWQIVKRLSN